MKQWEEGRSLTHSHLSYLSLSRSIWCEMRVGVGDVPVNLTLLEKEVQGGEGRKSKKGRK